MELTNKKHIILGHPILWCFLSLPISLVTSQLLSKVLEIPFTSLMAEGDLLDLVTSLVGSLCYVAIALLFIFVGRKAYGESFKLGLVKKNFKESLLLATPGLIVVAMNIIPSVIHGEEHADGILQFITVVVAATGVGFAEEICCRNFVIENAMQKFVNTKNGILLTLVISSVGFGALHLLNLTDDSNSVIMVLVQVFYAMVLGCLFGVVYLRTRNLWGAVIVHTLIDASSFYFGSAGQSTDPTQEDMLQYFVFSAIILAISIYMFRKSKREEVKALWASSVTEPNDKEDSVDEAEILAQTIQGIDAQETDETEALDETEVTDGE